MPRPGVHRRLTGCRVDQPNPIAADHTGEEVAYPRTAILGAVLLTGYLGGTTTSHMIDEKSLSATISCLSPSASLCGPAGGCAAQRFARSCRWCADHNDVTRHLDLVRSPHRLHCAHRKSGGPTYRALGRMILRSSACSRMLAHQPTIRLTAKVGVNICRGTPQLSMTTPA